MKDIHEKRIKTCHLHIGMHKTGSTSIQNYLEINRDKLLESGFYYAEMGSPNHSGPFLYSLCFDPMKDSEIQFMGLTSEELQQQVNLYQKKLNDALGHEYSDIIFSAEAIIKLTNEELIAFKEYLLNFVDEIKIYCYIREPIAYMASAFQQIIKAQPILLNNQGICPNYEEKFRKFEVIFEHVNYRIFSKKYLTDGNVVADFCNWLQIPFWGSNDVNTSLGALAVKFLYRFQHARKNLSFSQHNVELLENILSKLPYQKMILPTKAMSELINQNMKDFQWCAERSFEKEAYFDISDTTTNSYGNCYGTFSENEKVILDQLAKSSIEFDTYIKNQTGHNVLELISARLPNIEHLQFYIRKYSDTVISGWTCYNNDDKRKVELEIYLNNEYIDCIVADIHRDDLVQIDRDKRAVGYYYDFGVALQGGDLITIKVGNEIVFSGSFDY